MTGGIGSGKSEATKIFGELSVPLIDLDDIAHRITQKDYPGYIEIIKYFGTKAAWDRGVDGFPINQVKFGNVNICGSRFIKCLDGTINIFGVIKYARPNLDPTHVIKNRLGS